MGSFQTGALLIAAVWNGGCAEVPTQPVASSSPSASAQSLPRVDSAPNNEMAEGKTEAFGLKLPRGTKIVAALGDATYASGRFSFEATTNYIRARIHPGRVETGPNKTVFLNAALKADPKRRMDITVQRQRLQIELVIRDRTRKPAEQGLSVAERWQKAGFTPEGRPVNNKANE